MKTYFSLLLAGLFALTISSCHKRVLRGEGTVVSETRNVAKFTKVESNGSTRVKVVYDSDYYVIVSGYGNLVPAFETKVSGERLILEYKEKFWNVKNDNITVEVHTPYVDGIKLNGSGAFAVHGDFDQDDFRSEVNGSGNIIVAGGKFGTLRTKINGSGSFDSENSDAENVYAEISGSGNIYVYVSNYLNADISGSGDIYYSGNPASVDLNVSGSGNVHKRN